jgi:hypothetical protein
MSYTLPPKYERYANRLRELIIDWNEIIKTRDVSYYDGIQEFKLTQSTIAQCANWLTKAENILIVIFGDSGTHVSNFRNAATLLRRYGVSDHYVYRVLGEIEAALDDLENGFLINQEFLVAADVFDSVLAQAKHLLDAKYKDPAAVLGRVVMEDSLKRLARANGFSTLDNNGKNKKASVINDELKTANLYNQPQWRQLQAWFDIGNDAAHGNFSNFSDDDVKRMLEGIEAFLASYLNVV